MSAIDVVHLSKTFRQSKVLDALQFQVDEGELFGLIGPDGAGKSTLFNILITLLKPDDGCVGTISGYDILKDYKTIRNIIGYLPEKFSLYGDLTCEQNLDFFAMLYGENVENNQNLIAPIWNYLKPFKKRRASALSGGMKQKLALCCALIHKPKILFLDEPTTGVDPVARQELWGILTKLKNENITVFVSTSYMEEADYCTHVGLLQKGKMLGCDSPQKIKADFKGILVSIQTADVYGVLTQLIDFQPKDNVYAAGQQVNVVLKHEEDLKYLQQFINDNSLKCNDISITDPNIEDCFIQLMK
ncbi:MAG: ABC transporter ATP-binding protein [Bacteroidales bacterium]|jgi:ABC-type multidrug transport system ATPase subunit|nr:ABC transporter ATP-binding protein [Bacteroidales bacterium]